MCSARPLVLNKSSLGNGGAKTLGVRPDIAFEKRVDDEDLREEDEEDDVDPNNTLVIQRESIMPMLKVKKDTNKYVVANFKSPVAGHVPGQSEISRTKTLGVRVGRVNVNYRPLIATDAPAPAAALPTAKLPPSNPLVLFDPTPEQKAQGKQKIEVDPMLTRWLREHQREGVQFVFQCLMGMRAFDGTGCILADDMGLGKTLQSITIMWTLLKQGMDSGKVASPKALVVCPASLVKNWAAEIDKWLEGKCPCTPVAENCKDKVAMMFKTFKHDRQSLVLISSYETFRMHAKKLEGCPIDLVVCDEAHRLKNDRTKTAIAIAQLPTKRRLLLSGTPIQNDLDEFYALASLANPLVLGDPATFRRYYGSPIVLGREPDATPREQEVAAERLTELSEITNLFILRRTNQLLAKVLPPKLILNVFCKLTPGQREIYKEFLQSNQMRKMLRDVERQQQADGDGTAKVASSVALASLQNLMKLCNHPALIVPNLGQQQQQTSNGPKSSIITRRSATVPPPPPPPPPTDPSTSTVSSSLLSARGSEILDQIFGGRASAATHGRLRTDLSGKFLFTANLLKGLRDAPPTPGGGAPKDRVVIISNFTQTLDLFERHCKEMNYPCIRLDGTIGIKKRHELVTKFNDPTSNAFVFLLSSKAGGCGINLIGGNRLVMFDPDWNPANDKQALARVWRDGQKKRCFIYRLFTSGTIEEKIFQRQIAKDGLSAMIVASPDDASVKDSFGADMLRDLFTLKMDQTLCDTHDVLGCTRCDPEITNPLMASLHRDRFIDQLPATDFDEDDLLTWGHHVGVSGVDDDVLRKVITLTSKPVIETETGEQLEISEELAFQTPDGFNPVSFCMSGRIDLRGLEAAMAKKDDQAADQAAAAAEAGGTNKDSKKREAAAVLALAVEEGRKVTLMTVRQAATASKAGPGTKRAKTGPKGSKASIIGSDDDSDLDASMVDDLDKLFDQEDEEDVDEMPDETDMAFIDDSKKSKQTKGKKQAQPKQAAAAKKGSNKKRVVDSDESGASSSELEFSSHDEDKIEVRVPVVTKKAVAAKSAPVVTVASKVDLSQSSEDDGSDDGSSSASGSDSDDGSSAPSEDSENEGPVQLSKNARKPSDPSVGRRQVLSVTSKTKDRPSAMPAPTPPSPAPPKKPTPASPPPPPARSAPPAAPTSAAVSKPATAPATAKPAVVPAALPTAALGATDDLFATIKVTRKSSPPPSGVSVPAPGATILPMVTPGTLGAALSMQVPHAHLGGAPGLMANPYLQANAAMMMNGAFVPMQQGVYTGPPGYPPHGAGSAPRR